MAFQGRRVSIRSPGQAIMDEFVPKPINLRGTALIYLMADKSDWVGLNTENPTEAQL